MKRFKENKYVNAFIYTLIAVITYKIVEKYNYHFETAKQLLYIVSPFIYAFVFAYILNPIVKLFNNKLKLSRGLSILLTYIIVLGVLFVSVIYTIPSLIENILKLSENIPMYVEQTKEFINIVFVKYNLQETVISSDVMNSINTLFSQIGGVLVSFLQGSVTSLVSITNNIIKIVIGFLVSIYVLMDKDNLLEDIKVFMYLVIEPKRAEKVIGVVSVYNSMIGKYIGAKAIDSMIIGAMAMIGLAIVGAPMPYLLGIVVMVTNMIPYFGPLVGELVSALICIFVSPVKALIVFFMLLGIQQFDAWFLDPKLIGKSIGVRPIYLLFGILFFGGIFGPIGMLLASPTMATAKIYYNNLLDRKCLVNEDTKKEEAEIS